MYRSATHNVGRPNTTVLARDLLVLWGALSQDGSSLNTEVVSKRLGININAARKLMALVSSASGGDGEYLTLCSLDEDGLSGDTFDDLTLIESGGTRGRALSLTPQEYTALMVAFNDIGLDHRSGLRSKIRDAYEPEGIRQQQIATTLEAASSSKDYAKINRCAASLVDNALLSFEYPSSDRLGYDQRRVKPLSVHLSNDCWYLEAYDYGRRANRTFRIDRMRHITEASDLDSQGTGLSTDSRKSRTVQLAFHDPQYLRTLTWPNLVIQDTSQGATLATIPYYGACTAWLPRQIAACAGTVSTDDPQLKSDVIACASNLLKEQLALSSLGSSPEFNEATDVGSSE